MVIHSVHFRYMIVLAVAGAKTRWEERILYNNYEYIGLNDTFNCSISMYSCMFSVT